MPEFSPLVAATIMGLIGLPVGSFIRVVVRRVPRVASPINIRNPLVELGTGIAFALVILWMMTALDTVSTVVFWLVLTALLWFAAASIALTLIDFAHHRLPNAIVLPSLAAVATLLTVAALFMGDILRVASTLGGAAILFAVYLTLALIYPKGMGGGDVKLSALIGGVLGFFGWPAIAIGGVAGFLFGALWGLALMTRGGATPTTKVPFGPFMLVGAWVGLVWSDSIWQGYLRMSGLS